MEYDANASGSGACPTTLAKELSGFFCNVMEFSSEDVSIANILVVHDFPEVFPDGVSGMLIDKDIEFHIEVVPGTHPIYKAPDRMALAELKELKTQLQELLTRILSNPVRHRGECLCYL